MPAKDQGLAPQSQKRDLTALSLEQLGALRITTASLHEQSVADTPTSVTVNTAKEIKRSGYGPHIISRNLTPDHTGRPEGGNTFEQFLEIIRHGTDLDHLHPPCSTDPNNPNCLFALPGINPVDRNLLQVMPWPVFNNMPTQDLLAI